MAFRVITLLQPARQVILSFGGEESENPVRSAMMADNVTIQVGDKHYAIEPDHLPAVGTRIMAHKHLYDGGTNPLLEVVAHEWRLEEAPDENALPVFSITIQTRIVGK